MNDPQGLWELHKLEGVKGHPVAVRPTTQPEEKDGGGNVAPPEAAFPGAFHNADFREPHPEPTAEIPTPQESEAAYEDGFARIWARRIPDQEGSEPGCALEFRLRRHGPGRHRDRFLYVRFSPPARRHDKPRPWRRMLGGLPRKRQGRRHRKLVFAELSRELYWSSEVSGKDIAVQITVALFQLQILPSDASPTTIVKWLQSGRRRAVSDELAWEICSDILRNWSYPEHYRAFRRYVSRYLWFKQKETRGGEELKDCIPEEDVYGKIRESEDEVDFEADGESSSESSLTSKTPTLRCTEDYLAVHDAASILDLSPSYIYKLAKNKKLETTMKNGTISVSNIEFERLRARIDERRKRRIQHELMQHEGIKYETARKNISQIRSRP